MNQTEIEKLLEKAIGLRADSVGKASIRRAIGDRIKRLGLQDEASYLKQLKKRPAEIYELVEGVVVPETWFFRDHFPFVAMINHLAKVWDRSFGLRILSLPCSSGEEPYSIAMALLQAGISKDQFWIDAVDISKGSLELARNGRYTKNSFRSNDLRFRDIFFTAQGNEFIIKKKVRQKVHFFQGNILHRSFIDSLGSYDLIFSRNILIYFDEKSQQLAISNLERILKLGGVLFTGHAEAALFTGPGFMNLDYKRAFGVIKKPGQGLLSPKSQIGFSSCSSEKRTLERTKISHELRSENHIANGNNVLFTKAQKLADLGELNRAEVLCYKLLEDKTKVPSAALFYLLGVIKDSQGNVEEAIELLRKAVYLDPEHHESLVFLSLLAKRTGDEVGARNYRRRAAQACKE